MADFTLSAKLLGDSSSLEKACKASVGAIGAIASASAAAVLKIGKDSLEAYADYEQLTGGIDTLFGDAYDTVMKNADNAYKTAGLSANSYMEQVTSFSASLLQATGKDTEEAARVADMAMTDMADNANKMGTSMESIQNAYQGFAKQNYTMLDNLKLGYGGTKEEMQRLLDDAQKLTGVKYDINNLSDVYTAIHAVQDELGITGTTAKEAATTIQGSVGMMKDSWDNLLVGVADDKQAFDTLMDNFVDSVITVGENIIPRVEIIVGGIGNLISSLIEKVLPMLIEQIPGILDDALPLIASAAGTLIESIITVLPGLSTSVIDMMPQIISNILSFLPSLVSAGIEIIIALITGLNTAAPDILSTIVDVVLELVNAVTQPDMLSRLVMSAVTLIFTLANGLIDAIPLLNQSLPIIFDAIFNAFENIDWGQIGRNIIDGLINGLKSMVSSLGDAVVNIANGIANSFKSSLGIHSPSTLFMQYGIYTGEGYAIGIDKSADDIYKSFAALDLTSEIRALPAARALTVSGTTAAINTGGASSMEDIGDYIISAVNINAQAIADGISKMRLTADDREVARFMVKQGFVKM